MNYVACVKWGKKFGPGYVNKLYRMVQRHSAGLEFVCFTDDSQGIDKGVRIMPLPGNGLSGWWNKLSLFNNNTGLSGTVLFLDLDVIIVGDLNPFFDYNPGKFVILQSFSERINRPGFLSLGRHLANRLKKKTIFNSSVFRFDTKTNYGIWDSFLLKKEEIIHKYPGDQDWISECVRSHASIWPYSWCMSYKWEVAGKYDKDMPDGFRPFSVEERNMPRDLKIVVFHGKPEPASLNQDKLIIENYI